MKFEVGDFLRFINGGDGIEGPTDTVWEILEIKNNKFLSKNHYYAGDPLLADFEFNNDFIYSMGNCRIDERFKKLKQFNEEMAEIINGS